MSILRSHRETGEQKKRVRPTKKKFVSPQIVEMGSAVELIQGGVFARYEDGQNGHWGSWLKT